MSSMSTASTQAQHTSLSNFSPVRTRSSRPIDSSASQSGAIYHDLLNRKVYYQAECGPAFGIIKKAFNVNDTLTFHVYNVNDARSEFKSFTLGEIVFMLLNPDDYRPL